jgi:fumarate hydratase class II
MLRKVSEMISTICQNMNDEELMYLIYTTYGYEKHSDIYQHLYEKRETIAKRLYNKGIISYQKYQELLE